MVNVSIIIPTKGRQSVSSAIHSALSQTVSSVEIIVVDASGSGKAREFMPANGAVRLVSSLTPLNASAARSFGCAESKGRWIAFLDDDDVCSPDRLDSQLSAAMHAGRRHADFVTSDFIGRSYEQILQVASMSVSELRNVFINSEGIVLPAVKPIPEEDIVTYLFRRTTIRARKRLVTSSFLVDGELARGTPWSERLDRFEDWDWVSRLYSKGARWLHVHRPLVGIAMGAPQSLSVGRVSLSPQHILWPMECLRDRPRELGDLLCCDIGVSIAKQGDVAMAGQLFRLARVVGHPGWRAQFRLIVQLGLSSTIRRSRLEARLGG